MTSLTIKSILGNKARFVLTTVAVVLGVTFMAGTLVLTDTIRKSYNDLAGDVYTNADAVVPLQVGHVKSEDGDRPRRDRCRHAGSRPCGAGRQGRRAWPSGDRRGGREGRLSPRQQPQPPRPGARSDGGGRRSSIRSSWCPGTRRGAQDEIVIDRTTARKGHFAPGDEAHVCRPFRLHEIVVAWRADTTAVPTAQRARPSSRSHPRRRRACSGPVATTPST